MQAEAEKEHVTKEATVAKAAGSSPPRGTAASPGANAAETNSQSTRRRKAERLDVRLDNCEQSVSLVGQRVNEVETAILTRLDELEKIFILVDWSSLAKATLRVPAVKLGLDSAFAPRSAPPPGLALQDFQFEVSPLGRSDFSLGLCAEVAGADREEPMHEPNTYDVFKPSFLARLGGAGEVRTPETARPASDVHTPGSSRCTSLASTSIEQIPGPCQPATDGHEKIKNQQRQQLSELMSKARQLLADKTAASSWSSGHAKPTVEGPKTAEALGRSTMDIGCAQSANIAAHVKSTERHAHGAEGVPARRGGAYGESHGADAAPARCDAPCVPSSPSPAKEDQAEAQTDPVCQAIEELLNNNERARALRELLSIKDRRRAFLMLSLAFEAWRIARPMNRILNGCG